MISSADHGSVVVGLRPECDAWSDELKDLVIPASAMDSDLKAIKNTTRRWCKCLLFVGKSLDVVFRWLR